MKPKSKWLILAGAAVVAGLFLIFGLNRSAQAQHFTAKVERGDIHDVVDATGTINAVILVQVGSQVSGTIAKLYVDFNSRVHKGDIVALIDPALFKGALLQATADLDNAKANLVAARANLDKAKASLVQTKADYDRTAGLFKDGILSQQQLDLAKANYDSANATVGGAAANGRGFAASADNFYHRARPDEDAGVREDRRVRRRQLQGREAGHLQGGRVSEGNVSWRGEPGAHECDNGAKCGHLRHDRGVCQ